MDDIIEYNKSDFTLENVKKMKGEKKIFVVFSTFGEREADLIFDKISLLRKEIGLIIDKIYLSHRRVGVKQELTEIKAEEAYKEIDIINCNNYNVSDMQDEKGKGADMRRTLFHINKSNEIDPNSVIVVFLDADVVKEYFGSHFVLSLAGAILKGVDFAKSSFWREMGRVKKFVAQPLFSIIDHPKLNKLRDFHYPLSGEVAGTLSFFNSVNFWQIYGVETGINIDACMNKYSVADVNLGLYDHEHHKDENIQKMSFGILRTYLRQLIDYNIIELKDSAVLSDIFECSLIDENMERKKLKFDLTELKYSPLNEIL